MSSVRALMVRKLVEMMMFRASRPPTTAAVAAADSTLTAFSYEQGPLQYRVERAGFRRLVAWNPPRAFDPWGPMAGRPGMGPTRTARFLPPRRLMGASYLGGRPTL